MSKATRKEKVVKTLTATPDEALKKKPKKTRAASTYENPTPPGEKPNLLDFPKSYNPPQVECAWGAWWEAQGFFHNSGTGEPYVMVLPPPNVTGELHLGHALMASIEDALSRYYRMNGRDVIWVPGTDHAGIATQVRVEKMLALEYGKTRPDMTRDEFLEHAYAWNRKYGGSICNQLRIMGSSLDWQRYFFTLDETRSTAVTEAFVRLYEKGKIYRAERLVNWDCALQTVISDAEVEYKTLTGPTKLPVPNHKYTEYTFGILTHFFYAIADDAGQPTSEKLQIATTRLETMLGDEAIAIHSKDPRYTHLHGRSVYHPFRQCTIPIIIDDVLVDMAFGTGVVKVTPAHDPDDFNCGVRNHLKFTNILTPDGKINDIIPEFAGLPRFDARLAIVERLKELGLYSHEIDHPMRLGITQRGADICEQVVKEQWFIDTAEVSARALQVVADGSLVITPKQFEADWEHWHANPRPWCISRQLWWGHRIPAYRARVGDSLAPGWFVARTPADAIAAAATQLGVDVSTITLEQDEDVLDTWFSSALLPFSSFGWPDQSPEFDRYFPGAVLETGWDILTFWVSRMVIMSLELCDTVPFRRVLLHPLVRDPLGRKMSKSLGNVVDPLQVQNGVDLEALLAGLQEAHLPPRELEIATAGMRQMFPDGIPQCGIDAMRLALCSFAGAGRKAPINPVQIVTYSNFCNKMWNAVRFALKYVSDPAPVDAARLSHADRWVLARYAAAIQAAHRGFEAFAMDDSVQKVLHFFHNEFCSIYLETTKPIFQGADEERKAVVASVVYECIEGSLRLIHPFMPFVTEDLWQRIPRRLAVESIMIAPYPHVNEEWAAFDQHVIENAILCATAAREVKTKYGIVSNSMRVRIASDVPDIEEAFEAFSALALVGEVTRIPAAAPNEPGFSARTVNEAIEVRLDLSGLIDVEKERIAQEAKKKKLLENFTKLEGKIKGRASADKVPQNVQAAEMERLEQLRVQIAAVDEALSGLSQIGGAVQ